MGAGTSRSRQTGARRKPTWLATRFAALIALLLQAVIVQGHVHPAALAFGAGIERTASSYDGTVSHTEVSAPDRHAFGCPLCHALAASGSATLTDAASVAHAEATRTEAAGLAIAQAPRAHTHSWRSRAPPSHLSA